MKDYSPYHMDVHGPEPDLLQVVGWMTRSERRLHYEGSKNGINAWQTEDEDPWLLEHNRNESRLVIEGDDNMFAKAVAEKYPQLRVVIGWTDEQDIYQRWELKGGEGRLLDLTYIVTCWEAGLGVSDCKIRNGITLSREERMMHLRDDFAEQLALSIEDGPSVTGHTREEREQFIRETLDWYATTMS